ncbi:MAG: hypothetical protein ACRD5B_04125 [Nitrososphaeraceae archaeon]
MLITIVVSALLTFGNGFVIAIHNTTKPFFPRSTGPFIYYLFFSYFHFTKPYFKLPEDVRYLSDRIHLNCDFANGKGRKGKRSRSRSKRRKRD